MNWLSTPLGWLWILEDAVFVLFILYAFSLWARGIGPALWRLGNGLAKRKIALFAKGDNLDSLVGLLTDSTLFKRSNIIEVRKKEDVGRAESATLFLVFWHDWTNEIDDILSRKSDQCALIIYAPYDKGRIPDGTMAKLDGYRHTAVTNFRGRLLNDIVASMITTSYEIK